MTTTANKKTTKKDNYNAVLAILNAMEQSGSNLDMGEITYDSLREFVNNEIQLLDNKAAAAKKRAEEKKVEGDSLRDSIYDLVGEDWITADAIVEVINDPDTTRNMVISRLGQLIKLNKVEKETQNVKSANEGGKSRKQTMYRRKVEE